MASLGLFFVFLKEVGFWVVVVAFGLSDEGLAAGLEFFEGFGVLGRLSEVGGFVRVVFQVVEFLVDGLFSFDGGGEGVAMGFILLFIKVAEVFIAGGADGLNAGVVLPHE